MPGWTSLLVPLSLIGGLQLLAIGAVGEYVGKIHKQAQERPLYVVAETKGWDDDAEASCASSSSSS